MHPNAPFVILKATIVAVSLETKKEHTTDVYFMNIFLIYN